MASEDIDFVTRGEFDHSVVELSARHEIDIFADHSRSRPALYARAAQRKQSSCWDSIL